MGISELALLGFLGGAIIHFLFRRLVISVAGPTVALALWVVFTEFLVPNKGGGASMWPIALIFVAASSAVGALGGASLVEMLMKMGKSK